MSRCFSRSALIIWPSTELCLDLRRRCPMRSRPLVVCLCSLLWEGLALSPRLCLCLSAVFFQSVQARRRFWLTLLRQLVLFSSDFCHHQHLILRILIVTLAIDILDIRVSSHRCVLVDCLPSHSSAATVDGTGLNHSLHLAGKTDHSKTPTKDSGSRNREQELSSSAASPQPWNPPSLQRRNGAVTEQDRLEALRRGIRSSLNKLTPENFEKVAVDLTNVVLKHEIILSSVIDLIFQKALEEPQYNSLYAQLCRRLSDKSPNQENFRKVLLTQVQNVYVLRTSATGESVRRRKQEHLSNIKFIGELGKLDLLHERILHVCIQELLGRTTTASPEEKKEDLECLCQMIRIIGKPLDSKPENKIQMDDYMLRLQQFADDKRLPSRIRFLCLDVVELRSNKWIPRRIHQANAPKTITEIREEIRAEIGAAAKEALHVDFDSSTRLSPQKGQGYARPPNGPRTVAEKQQQQDSPRSGGMQQQQQRYAKGDYNRGGYNSYNKQPAAPIMNRAGDARKSVLKILSQDSQDGSQGVSLRPQTSLMPQRPMRLPESARVSKDYFSPPPARPASSPAEVPQVVADKAKSTKVQQPLNKNELVKAMSAILTAYFDGAKDRLNAVTAIQELSAAKRFKSDLIGLMLQMGMENGEVSREKISELIVHLTCESWVTDEDVREGFERLLDTLDSGLCDPKPCMAAYLGDLVISGILTFRSAMTFLGRGHHFPLVLLYLQRLEQLKGADYLTESLTLEGIDLLKWFPEKDLKLGVEHVVDTLTIYGLTFLCPGYRLQSQLGKLLADGAGYDNIRQFLGEHELFESKTLFIFSLLISLVKHIHCHSLSSEIKGGDSSDTIRVNEDRFKKNVLAYKALFTEYLESAENQLLALYAVQTFYQTIGFPKGWVLCWFCVLHEFDIVEPETFNLWRDEVNDAYPGKGKALFQVNNWLEWLNNIESESDTEDTEETEQKSPALEAVPT